MIEKYIGLIKKLRLITWNNAEPLTNSNISYIDYDIGGNEHNVPYIKILINKIIEANKNFLIIIFCSKTYTSRKPSNVILTNFENPDYTPQQHFLPFNHAIIKLYYK